MCRELVSRPLGDSSIISSYSELPASLPTELPDSPGPFVASGGIYIKYTKTSGVSVGGWASRRNLAVFEVCHGKLPGVPGVRRIRNPKNVPSNPPQRPKTTKSAIV